MSKGRKSECNPQQKSLPYQIDGIAYKACYYEWGDVNSSNVILCLHALNRNGRDFDFIAQALSRNFRIICLDLPGRGNSDWLNNAKDYNNTTYLHVIDRLIESTQLCRCAINIIGTSLGGILAMIYTAEHKNLVKRLVINDVGSVISGEIFHKAALSIRKNIRFRSLDHAVMTFKIMTSSCGPLSDHEWVATSSHMLSSCDDGGYVLRYDLKIADQLLIDSESGLNLWDVYDQIGVPTLLVRGEQSEVLPEEIAYAMSQRGPKASCHTVPGTGHFPMLIKNSEINIVKNFLCSK